VTGFAEKRLGFLGGLQVNVQTKGCTMPTGSPSTFRTRPRVSGPTGTEIGAPVSIAVIPLVMPSVGFIATARTRFSPRCCSTSATTSICSTPGRPSDTIRTAL
jgi:hypothetical protein